MWDLYSALFSLALMKTDDEIPITSTDLSTKLAHETLNNYRAIVLFSSVTNYFRSTFGNLMV